MNEKSGAVGVGTIILLVIKLMAACAHHRPATTYPTYVPYGSQGSYGSYR